MQSITTQTIMYIYFISSYLACQKDISFKVNKYAFASFAIQSITTQTFMYIYFISSCLACQKDISFKVRFIFLLPKYLQILSERS